MGIGRSIPISLFIDSRSVSLRSHANRWYSFARQIRLIELFINPDLELCLELEEKNHTAVWWDSRSWY